MLIGVLIGYGIGLSILSALDALLVKLSARLLLKKTIGFGVAFLVAFISLAAGILIQSLFDARGSRNSFLDVLPGIIFFLSCWLLTALFVKARGDDELLGFTKAFLITLVQCGALFILVLIISFVLIAGLLNSLPAAK